MRRTIVLPGWLSLVVLASPGAPLDRNPAVACEAIQITAPGAPAPPKRKAKKPTFSASSILDLKFEVGFPPALKGPHTLSFKVFTPKGHLYQTLSAPVSSHAGPADRRTRGSARRTAVVMLPVAGTTIVNNSLYGEWKVEAYLDGARSTACTKSLSFVIQP